MINRKCPACNRLIKDKMVNYLALQIISEEVSKKAMHLIEESKQAAVSKVQINESSHTSNGCPTRPTLRVTAKVYVPLHILYKNYLKKLEDIYRTENSFEMIASRIQTEFDSIRTKTFVQALATSIVRNCLDMNFGIEEQRLSKFLPILKKYTSQDKHFEYETLVCIQELHHKMHCPGKFNWLILAEKKQFLILLFKRFLIYNCISSIKIEYGEHTNIF